MAGFYHSQNAGKTFAALPCLVTSNKNSRLRIAIPFQRSADGGVHVRPLRPIDPISLSLSEIFQSKVE